MKIAFKKSFLKDLKKLRDKQLKNSIAKAIEDVEAAKELTQVKNLKKMEGYSSFYRIRIGDYRIGLQLMDKELIYFVAFDHRKDIYTHFP